MDLRNHGLTELKTPNMQHACEINVSTEKRLTSEDTQWLFVSLRMASDMQRGHETQRVMFLRHKEILDIALSDLSAKQYILDNVDTPMVIWTHSRLLKYAKEAWAVYNEGQRV